MPPLYYLAGWALAHEFFSQVQSSNFGFLEVALKVFT